MKHWLTFLFWLMKYWYTTPWDAVLVLPPLLVDSKLTVKPTGNSAR